MMPIFFPSRLIELIGSTCERIVHTLLQRISRIFSQVHAATLLEKPSQPEYLTKSNHCIVKDIQQQLKVLQVLSQVQDIQQMIIAVQTSSLVLVISNNSNPTILMPNRLALESKAKHYFIKYGIEIHIIRQSDLPEFCARLHKEHIKPAYLGIILMSADPHEAHVVPVLLYLGDRNEAIVLDVIVSTPLSIAITETLMECHFELPYDFIQSSRQADSWSCRTAAITILRNALLDIKFNRHTKGFHWSLKKKPGTKNTYEFPITWTYTEQIFNGGYEAQRLLVIRRFFSNKPEKRNQPQTIERFRNQHTKVIRLQYSIEGPPKLVYTASRTVNCYLTDKATKNHAQLTAPVRETVPTEGSTILRRKSRILKDNG